MRLVAGARLGPYEVLSFIGSGGMGEVYRARDVRLDRHVAIKLPPDTIQGDPHAQSRFEQEARAAAALSHPHICAIFDVGRQDDTPFIVMEFLDGETLAHRLAAGALAVEVAMPIAAQVADALTEAHRTGLIHRDLKPGNVMLVRAGAKLLDFGIARFTADGPRAIQTTHATVPPTDRGTIVGTLQYMSPEQLEGHDLLPSTDVFSLGAVLYEMLTGRAAFAADSRAAIIAAILMRSPSAPRQVVPSLPAELSDLIEECLSKDPLHRPTAGNVYTRLRSMGGGPPASSRHVASRSSRAIRSLAVLALATSLKREAEDAFSAGMVDALIGSFAAYPSLRVISRMSSQRFTADPAPVESAARELHVDAVVGLEFRENDTGRLTIDAELISGSTQSRLWSGQFSCDRSEVLQVPDQIAQAIGEKIRAGSAKHRAVRLRRVDRRVHEHCLKGSFLLESRIGQWIESSFDEFTAAVNIDNGFAPAHAGLSRCYATAAMRVSSGQLGRLIRDFREGIDRAEAEARAALALDPEHGPAHSALAQVHWMRFQLTDAEDAFRRALALDPGDTGTLVRYSLFVNLTGRFEEALSSSRLARELNPLATLPFECLSVVLYTGREFEACIACCDEGLELNPHAVLLHLYRGLSQARLDRLDDAVTTLEVARAESADEASTVAALAMVHARRGDTTAVEGLLRQLAGGDDLVSLAEIYVAVDRPHDALEALEKAFERSEPKLLSIGVDPAFDSIRDRPRFKRLLIGTGLASYVSAQDR